MNDVNAERVVVQISLDGKTLWINTEKECVCRVSGIKKIEIDDMREMSDKDN